MRADRSDRRVLGPNSSANSMRGLQVFSECTQRVIFPDGNRGQNPSIEWQGRASCQMVSRLSGNSNGVRDYFVRRLGKLFFLDVLCARVKMKILFDLSSIWLRLPSSESVKSKRSVDLTVGICIPIEC